MIVKLSNRAIADGVKVRDPRSKRHVPPEGMRVGDNDQFWLRRLRDGDVVLAGDLPPAPATVKEG